MSEICVITNPFESRAYYIEVLSEFLSNTLRVGVTVSGFCLSNDIINKRGSVSVFLSFLRAKENAWKILSSFSQLYYAAHIIDIIILPGSHVSTAAPLV